MAELLLKVGTVGPDPMYQDGDIICAFTDERISQVHAEIICHHSKFPFNSKGLRGRNTLLEFFLKNAYEFKFERVSPTELRRTNLKTNESKIIGPNPDADGDYCNVELYLNHAKRNPNHLIFGDEGSEIFYISENYNPELDLIWQEIEDKTTNRRVNFQLWPLSDQEKKSHLAVRLNGNMGRSIAEDLANPIFEYIGQVKPDGSEDDIYMRVKKKRRNMVDWPNRLGLTQGQRNQVRDKGRIVDIRNLRFDRTTIVTRKPD